MSNTAKLIATSANVIKPGQLLAWTQQLMQLNMEDRKVVVEAIGDRMDWLYDWMGCIYLEDFVVNDKWANDAMRVLEANCV